MKLRVAGWSIGGAVVALILGAMGWGVLQAAGHAPKSLVGDPAPDLAITSLDGGQYRISDFHGRPVVLNFWASWCVPCRQEAPVLAAAARANQARIQFVGVDIQDTDQAARAYEAEIQSPYPAGPVSRGSYRDYGVTSPPETFFIDARGVVVSKVIGALDSHRMGIYLSQLQA